VLGEPGVRGRPGDDERSLRSACLSGLADAQHDYVANGFYAISASEEKRCPALEANQLTDITDVTAQVDAATAGKSDRAFHEAERAIKAQIESQCGTAADVRCQVVELYQGGVYDLYKYKRYQDIRIVFAPEASIAFFGGDPDNFNFPRFDLDSAFVRIYDNGMPLHTDQYLKFARRGVKPGDITFTSGNPGGTDREDTLAALAFQRDTAQALRVDVPVRVARCPHRVCNQGSRAGAHFRNLAFQHREYAQGL
jgi:hypothetical protein